MSGLLEGTSPQPAEDKNLSFPILSAKESKAAQKGNLKSKPTCARCKNHGMTNYRIGHKGSCVFETCTCELCRATKARNKSMAATMANERRLTAQKRQMSNPGGVVADSSSSVAAQIMCNVKPEYDNLDSEQQTPDTTSYDRPVKRQRMSSPSTLSDVITSQTPYTTYLPQGTDTARWQYDCLRQNLDPTRMYNMYNPGMSQFSQQHLPTSCLDDKRILEQYANSGIGKITRTVQPYNMSEILRPSNTTDIMQRHNLIQQGVHQTEDPLMQSNKGL